MQYTVTYKGPSKLKTQLQYIWHLYKGKGQIVWSLQDHGNTNLPLKEDNLCITVKLHQNWLIPKCQLFRGFTIYVMYVCTYRRWKPTKSRGVMPTHHSRACSKLAKDWQQTWHQLRWSECHRTSLCRFTRDLLQRDVWEVAAKYTPCIMEWHICGRRDWVVVR